MSRCNGRLSWTSFLLVSGWGLKLHTFLVLASKCLWFPIPWTRLLKLNSDGVEGSLPWSLYTKKLWVPLVDTSINHLLWWFRFPREKKPRGNKCQKVVDHPVIHCDDAHCDKDDCMGCQPEPRKKCRVPRTKEKKKKKKKRRRRRRRKSPCRVVCTPCKEQKCPGRCIVRVPLKARLSGCTFRDYLFLTFPGYRSLEGVLILHLPIIIRLSPIQRYMCGLLWALPTPHTNFAIGAGHELSYLGSNCDESWRLLFWVLESQLDQSEDLFVFKLHKSSQSCHYLNLEWCLYLGHILCVLRKTHLSSCVFCDYLLLTFPRYCNVQDVLILCLPSSILFLPRSPCNLPRYVPMVGTSPSQTTLAVGSD